MMEIRLDQGFHVGAGENVMLNWKEWWQALHAAVLPVNAITADHAGHIWEIQEAGNLADTLVYRQSLWEQGCTIDPNVPRYDHNPEDEAIRRMEYKYGLEVWGIGDEDFRAGWLDPSIIWLKDTNEIRTQTNPGDEWYNDLAPGEWWGRYALKAAAFAVSNGYRVILLSPSSGDHDYEFWEQPSMLAFLSYAIAHPYNVIIGLHEYSYVSDNLFAMIENNNATIEDIATTPPADYWQLKVGRFKIIFEVCDTHRLGGWPRLYFCEWGWALNDMPSTDAAIGEIEIATLAIYGGYYKYIAGFGTWYLGVSDRFGRRIAEKTSTLQLPCARIASEAIFVVDEKIPGEGEIVDPPDVPDPPAHEPVLGNPCFSDGWETVAYGNQRPFDWLLDWYESGQHMRNGKEATKHPECLHKLSQQLPPHEQPGGDDALILCGDAVYKIFTDHGRFGALLSALVTDTLPGATYEVTIKVRVHYHDACNEIDDVTVWLDVGESSLEMGSDFFTDRQWVEVTWRGEADDSGLPVTLEVNTGYENSRDFFIDQCSIRLVSLPPDAERDEGEAREPFRKITHVADPRYCSPANIAEVYDIARVALQTATPSYDQAGIGSGLKSKRAIVYNVPAPDRAGLLAWFKLYYASTQVDFVTLGEVPPPGNDNPPMVYRPCDTQRITQRFGENPPQYPMWGECGHEGIDMGVAWGHPFYATQAGIVAYAGDRRWGSSDPSLYGWHVVILHAIGGRIFHTLYAHAEPNLPVNAGDHVEAGDVVGLSGNTGNSTGYHLHYSVLVPDPTGCHPRTTYGYFIDPEYVVSLPAPDQETPPPVEPPPGGGSAILGLHHMADGGDVLGNMGSIFSEFSTLPDPKAIKVLSTHSPQDVAILSRENPQASWTVRPFLSFGGRFITPEQFVNDTIGDTERTMDATGKPHTQIVIELHNEPNLTAEGLHGSWGGGEEFGAWLLRVFDLYKTRLPQALYITPGLSPGVAVPGVKDDSVGFFEAMKRRIGGRFHEFDGVAVHCYWASSWPMAKTIEQLDVVLDQAEGLPVWVTEASNNKQSSPETMAAEYVTFWQACRQRPQVRDIHYFVVRASDQTFADEVWVNEDGQSFGIAQMIADNPAT